MAAEQGIRAEQEVEERLALEQKRRDTEGIEKEIIHWTLVDDAQGGAIVQP